MEYHAVGWVLVGDQGTVWVYLRDGMWCVFGWEWGWRGRMDWNCFVGTGMMGVLAFLRAVSGALSKTLWRI